MDESDKNRIIERKSTKLSLNQFNKYKSLSLMLFNHKLNSKKTINHVKVQ
ncbi:MAG: hypothetical protein U9Q66_04600 [Patescibacteria group bacterium]|nr:hypothetical protein [Patescibacteria group bacterium]